jgi:hypothetical protein
VTAVPGLLTRIFLDTKFADDGRLIQPVSLALDSQTGLSTTRSPPAAASTLPPGRMAALACHPAPAGHILAASGSGWAWDAGHADYPRVRPPSRAAAEVRAFIGRQPEPEVGALLLLALRRRGPVPALRAERPARRDPNVHQGPRARSKPDRDRPAGAGPAVHHALHDARHDRLIAQAIGLIQ